MKENSVKNLCSAETAKTALQALTTIRRYPERFHNITKKQYSEFKEMHTIEDVLRNATIKNAEDLDGFYKALNDVIKKGEIDELVGWNAGIINDKPWYLISWYNTSGSQFLGCMISTKKIEKDGCREVVSIFENNNIFHLSKKFKPVFRQEQNPEKYWNIIFETTDEGQNGNFFTLVLKIKDSRESDLLCNVRLAPIDALVKFNEEYKKRPFKNFEYQNTKVSNIFSANAIDSISDVRIFPSKYNPLTDNQWLNLDSKASIIELNKQFNNLSRFRKIKDITVGGYTMSQIAEGVKNAEKAKDDDAVKVIKDLQSIWKTTVKNESVMPNTKIKKILGWNAGRMQSLPSVPWFSVAYEDMFGRIMMCVWISNEKMKNLSYADIDDIMQFGNNIYVKENNFINIWPFQDPDHFTFSVKSITEKSGKSFCVIHVLLQENADTPCVCHAFFCPNESLNQINTNIQISKKILNQITTNIELTNKTLKDIDTDAIGLVFYDESNHDFSIITRDQDSNNSSLVKRSKNIFAKQIKFTEYKGTYGTQKLLPDILMTHLGLLIDNDDIREQYDNNNETFSLDKLYGTVVLNNGWTTINYSPQHLALAPWFREEYFSYLDNIICFRYDGKKLYSNYESDLMSCWKDIINDYVGKAEEVTVLDSPEGFSFDDILVYSASENGRVEFATRKNNKIRIYSSKIGSANTFKQFFDDGLRKENSSMNRHRRGWRSYQDATGRFISIRLDECFDNIFNPMRIRQKIVELKMAQMNDDDPRNLCALILACKDDFFTHD